MAEPLDNLGCLIGPGSQEEVGKDGFVFRTGIAKIIKTQPKRQGKVGFHLPCILHENTLGCSVKEVLSRLGTSGERIVREIGFVIRTILNQIEEIVESETGVGIRRCEVGQVVAMPTFITHLELMRSADGRQNVSPAIVVLNKAAVREAHAKARTLPGDG